MTLLGMDLDSIGTGGVCMRISRFNMDRQYYVVLALRKEISSRKICFATSLSFDQVPRSRSDSHVTALLKLKRYRPAKI